MKSPTQTSAKKQTVPKAFAGYTDHGGIKELNIDVSRHPDPSTDRLWVDPVAVIPTASAKQAKLICAVHNMGDNTITTLVAHAIFEGSKGRLLLPESFPIAAAVLAALGLGGGKG